MGVGGTRLATRAVIGLCVAGPCAAAPAELVLTNARIVTEDARQPTAQALAITGGKLVFVGSNAGARAYVGPATRTEDAGGRLVLPGLVDAHIHPLGTADVPRCTLDSRTIALKDLASIIKTCISRFGIKPGDWVEVQESI